MKKSIKILWRVVFIGIIAVFLLVLLINWGLLGPMPSVQELENPSADIASEVYAQDGTLMGKYYLEDRVTTDYNQISLNVIKALVATEDERFYEHSGIDPKGTLAIPFYLLTGRKRGSSTITQQLALNLFGERAHNPFIRALQKLKEWVLAVKLERNFTKQEILALYLNTVPFGDNVYGIKNASMTFFSKPPDRLSIPEAATLIAMLKGTALYNPRRNPRYALDRRNTVINNMQKNGYITAAEAEKSKATPIQLQYNKLDHNDGIAPYFREYLRDYLKTWCKENKKADGSPYNLYKDGLKIYTTIDPRMQLYAKQAVAQHLAELQPIFDKQSYIKSGRAWKGHENYLTAFMKNTQRYKLMKQADASDKEIEKAFNTKVPMQVFAWNRNSGGERNIKDTVMTPMDSIKYMRQMLQSGFLAMDPQSGEIKAWVGGTDFRYFKYDHVNNNTKRQVGSTIKPLLYTAAIMNGFTPNTEVPDQPVEFPSYHWISKNDDGSVEDMVPLEDGLARSLNNVAAYLIKQLHPQTLVDFAHKCGITSDIPPYPSIALGTTEISLWEMVQAYSIFPGKGFLSKPVFLLRIEDRNGNVLQNFAPQRREVINENDAYTMVKMMEGVVNHGTAARVRFRYNIQSELAGKTGTTNDNTNGWFIGYSPQILAGAWVGCDNNFLHFTSTHIGQGANTGLPIWALFIKKLYNDPSLGIDKGAHFDQPPGWQPPPENPYDYQQNGVNGAAVPGTGSPDFGNGNASDYLSPGQSGNNKGNAKDTSRKPKSLYKPH